MTPLYVLKATWAENYDCPDNGLTHICDVFDIIALSSNKATLDAIAADLSAGYKGQRWSERRSDHLRKLYCNYDDFRDATFTVEDASSLVIP